MEPTASISRSSFTAASAQDGLSLDGLAVWPPSPRAVLQLSHGMCEHKERYLPFMEFMAGQGFLCVIHDHRGHGKSAASADDLGYFYAGGGPALVKDLRQITRLVRRRVPRLPFFLFGHSMGSLAVRVYLKYYERELDGLIVCGSPSGNPLAGPALPLISLLARVKGEHARSALINRLVSAPFERPFASERTEHAWICSDREVVARYNASPYCNFTFTLNGYRALLWLMAAAYSKKGWDPQKPGLPILFLSGRQDPCMVSPKKFRDAVGLLRQAGYRNVSARLYPGMRHEILNETGRLAVFEDILRFLDSALSDGPGRQKPF